MLTRYHTIDRSKLHTPSQFSETFKVKLVTVHDVTISISHYLRAPNLRVQSENRLRLCLLDAIHPNVELFIVERDISFNVDALCKWATVPPHHIFSNLAFWEMDRIVGCYALYIEELQSTSLFLVLSNPRTL